MSRARTGGNTAARAKALQQRADQPGLVVHEGPAGCTGAQYDRIRKTLSDEFACQCREFRTAVALAAEESEGRLLLLPDAFSHVRPRWKVPDRLLDRDTSRVKDAEEELTRGLGLPVLRGSDGPRSPARRWHTG